MISKFPGEGRFDWFVLVTTQVELDSAVGIKVSPVIIFILQLGLTIMVVLPILSQSLLALYYFSKLISIVTDFGKTRKLMEN